MKPERIEAIYDELEKLVIDLDPDPGARGPGYLQDLISKTRGFLNKTSLMLHEVHRHQHALERELVALEAAFELSSDSLLASDGRVTKLPNIDDRKAMINLLLREDRVKILDLKKMIKEVGFVEKVVKHRHKELDNTMSSIRIQKSLIDSELRTGSFYGDESRTSRGSAAPKPVDDIDEAELARLLGDEIVVDSPAAPAAAVDDSVGIEEPEPQAVGVDKKAEPNTDSDEDPAIRKFLEGDDFSDILADL